MNFEPSIIDIEEKKLVGMSINTSLAENKTKELWQNFMPLQKNIEQKVSDELFSVQIFNGSDFNRFTPQTKFEKWAAIEVSDYQKSLFSLEKLSIPAGKYALFTYKGLHADFPKFSQYVFKSWLPQSGYLLDNRPHFEIMGKTYFGPLNPESEEYIYIPIK